MRESRESSEQTRAQTLDREDQKEQTNWGLPFWVTRNHKLNRKRVIFSITNSGV